MSASRCSCRRTWAPPSSPRVTWCASRAHANGLFLLSVNRPSPESLLQVGGNPKRWRPLSIDMQVKLKFHGDTVAQVLYFSVAEAVKQEGSYARGSVWVQPLPEELHGRTKLAVPLRRLEGAVKAMTNPHTRHIGVRHVCQADGAP